MKEARHKIQISCDLTDRQNMKLLNNVVYIIFWIHVHEHRRKISSINMTQLMFPSKL